MDQYEKPEFVTVMTTAAAPEQARSIAAALVREKLAACVQIASVTSCYAWEGKVNTDPELLLLIKTRAALFERVAARIKALHAYKVPEILCLPVLAGSADYLSWLRAETTPADGPD